MKIKDITPSPLPPSNRGFLRFLALFFLFLAFSSAAFAQNKTTLKFVFPFGDDQTASVCPLPNRVIGGCCDDTARIFTRSGKKGCCPAGNDIETVGTNQGCCYPVTPPQTRWGQTSSSPCGGYCAGGSAVLSYSTISSCCADCPHNDDVRAFMSKTKVCGTCCSKIPDNCGNAGYRVCEEATGSAYCSVDPTKCMPATDWIVGSEGQGGYSCCASCDGTRYAHTNSVCGNCCSTGTSATTYSTETACCTNLTPAQVRWDQTITSPCGKTCSSALLLSVGATSSCCPAITAPQTRWGQTSSSVCGGYCPVGSAVVSYSTISSCCANLTTSQIRWSQTTASVCGTPVVCGTGATMNAQKTVCICNTGFEGTWKPDTGSGNGCTDPETTCKGKMAAAGYNAANYTVSGNTITYTGAMTVSKNLDISNCNLIVKASNTTNGLAVNASVTLQAKSIDVTSNTSAISANSGLLNDGTIKTGSLTVNTSAFMGIRNNAGGRIEATTITAIGSTRGGIQNYGTINADTVIGNGGGATGIQIPGGTITASTVIGNGGGTGDGIQMIRGGTISASEVTGNGVTYGIFTSGGMIKADIVIATGSAFAINNAGTIIAPKVYYCSKWTGTKPANAVCKAGCTCTN